MAGAASRIAFLLACAEAPSAFPPATTSPPRSASRAPPAPRTSVRRPSRGG